jgi:ABC-type oligopeptide transport system substrate-binding subunit
MARISLNQTFLGTVFVAVSLFLSGCASSASNRYWGKTVAPTDNVLRYISGSEPESLDPAFGTGQPEARVYMALYEGLLEYHPKTMEPIPAIAERWELSLDGTEYIFHLRKNAKFTNGDPITAKDFVYTFRRALSPELASRNANLGYYIKYSEAYNSGNMFVKDGSGQFLLVKDFVKETEKKASDTPEAEPKAKIESASANFGAATEFQNFINAPERLVIKGDKKERAKQLEAEPKLKAAIEGKELVPVTAENLGVEAVDDYTLRLKLYQPAPYFIQLIPHQLFRVVHQPSIERFGKNWQRVGNIVGSGAFMLSVHRPYDELVVVKNPHYWDAANVRLDAIEFYPLEEATTMMNLYKGGSVDSVYNHIVPPAWLDEIRRYKSEYQDHPEVANEYYSLSVKKPPMDNLKVRQALSLAIDRNALAQFRKTPKPLSNFTPDGIFPKYDEARKKVFGEKLKAENITVEEWSRGRIFDPEKARKLMTEAGYPVVKAGNGWSCPTFPVDKVTLNYNTAESNKAVAEFNQAQWKQNLGITIPLKNMEWKTFLPFRSGVQYEGIARNAWVGDYMDPFTFLNLFYSPQNDGATGFWDPKYDALLDAANKELDEQKRLEMLATAEFQILQEQLVIPLVTQATNWIKKPYVKGLYPNPGTLHAWKFVYLETDPNKWDANSDNLMKESDPQVDEQINRLTATMTKQK